MKTYHVVIYKAGIEYARFNRTGRSASILRGLWSLYPYASRIEIDREVK